MKNYYQLLFLFLMCSHWLNAQEKISLDMKKERLEKAFKEIERQSSYRFVYSNNLLENKQKVTLKVIAVSFEEAMSRLLENTALSYKMTANFMVIILPDNKQVTEEKTISGQVTDEKGVPLESVSVTIKDVRHKGTVTDEKGNFQLVAPGGASALHFNYVGMEPELADVVNSNKVNIVMHPLINNSQAEVIVVGYGAQPRMNMTSAVSSVQAKELVQRAVVNPAQLLQGKLPGLQVTQSSGEPGNENVLLQVRGKATFGASNNPLVIIDGLPGDITALNEYDIESISVLKDAASATIYGSRGAPGVIVVTTRKGPKNESTQIELVHSIGVQNATRLPEMIWNSVEYMELYNEGLRNVNKPERFSQADIDKYRNSIDPRYPQGFDWMDANFKNVIVNNYYLAFKGRKNNTSYNLSLGHNNQPGTFNGFDYKKYTLQFNLSSKMSNRIKVGINALINYGARYGQFAGGHDQLLSLLAQAPMLTPTTPNGHWAGSTTLSNGVFVAGNKNPFVSAQSLKKTEESVYSQTNLFFDINIVDGLTIENRGGINFKFVNTKVPIPNIPMYDIVNEKITQYLVITPLLIAQNDFLKHITGYSQLHLTRKFGDYDINAIAGVQTEYDKGGMLSGTRLGFQTYDFTELDAGSQGNQQNAGNAAEWAMHSWYTSADIAIKNRYLIGASFRIDGTSKLSPGKRYGSFYSVSGGWRVNEESFLSDISWLSNLKLRVSWGKLGNQDIGTYPYQSILTSVPYTFGTATTLGLYQPQFENQNLTWENTFITNLGLDAAFIKNRLSVTFDYYIKNTRDILRSAQIAAEYGLTSPTINKGVVHTTGYELSLGYRNTLGRKLNYNIEFSIDGYKSKVINFGNDEADNFTIKRNGIEYKAFYLYEYEGIFQTEDEVKNHADMSKLGVVPHPGDIKLKDQDGNGVINDADKKVFTGQNPSYNYSFKLGIEYAGFDFQAFIYGLQGKKYFYTNWGIDPFFQEGAPTVDWRNRWTPQNPSTTMPRIYKADYLPVGPQQYFSSYYLKDGSYLRLRNITIGYTLKKNAASFISDIRFFFTADNLITITKFTHLGDPERTNLSGDPIRPLRIPAYPQLKTFILGLSMKLQ